MLSRQRAAIGSPRIERGHLTTFPSEYRFERRDRGTVIRSARSRRLPDPVSAFAFDAGQDARFLEHRAKRLLADRLAGLAGDDGEIPGRPGGDDLCQLGKHGDRYPRSGFFSVDRDDAIPDVLLAEPDGVAPAKPGKAIDAEHDPFPRSNRPAGLELL